MLIEVKLIALKASKSLKLTQITSNALGNMSPNPISHKKYIATMRKSKTTKAHEKLKFTTTVVKGDIYIFPLKRNVPSLFKEKGRELIIKIKFNNQKLNFNI